MIQGAFDFEEHEENKARVSSRIGWAIVHFLEERLRRPDRTFHADELHGEVLRATGIAAPASSDRILRDLRQKRVVDYRVLNRRQSLYQVVSVGEESQCQRND